VEEKGILLIHLISFTCADVSKGYLSLPHVKEIRCIKRMPFSSTCEGDQMYQKDNLLFHTWRRSDVSKGYLSLFTCGRERYPFDTSDLLHVWKRKV
jgi:hypothetical protein